MGKSILRISLTLGIFVILAVVGAIFLRSQKAERPIDSNPSDPASKTPYAAESAKKNKVISTNLEITSDEEKDASQNRKTDDPDWIEAAMEAMKDPDVPTRVRAIQSLIDHASPEAIRLLESFLVDGDHVVIQEIIDTLGAIGMNSDFKALAFEVLAKIAREKDNPFKGHALITAAMFMEGDKLLPIIDEFLAEENNYHDAMAVRAMTFIASPECVPFLTEILAREKDPQVQKNGLIILARIGTEEAFELFKENISSKTGHEQANTVWALTRAENDLYYAMLTEAILNDQLYHEALSIIATSQAAPEIYNHILTSEDVSDEDKQYYLNTLANNASHSPGSVRNGIAHVLANLLDGSNSSLEIAALETLAKLGASEDFSEQVVPKLESKNPLVQGAALQAFAQYCRPDNYKPLIKLWYHEDEKMRRTAFLFSEAFMNQSDMEDLQRATQHNDEFIAKQANIMIKYLTQGNS